MTGQNTFSYARYKEDLTATLATYQCSRENYEKLISSRNEFGDYDDSNFSKNVSVDLSYDAVVVESNKLLAPHFLSELTIFNDTEFLQSNYELWLDNMDAERRAEPLISKIGQAQTKRVTLKNKYQALSAELAAAKLAEQQQQEENQRAQEIAKRKRTSGFKFARNLSMSAVIFFIADHFLLAGYVRSLILPII